ncbi:MAG: hypothetical protein ACJAZ2_000570 [Glaciecola sp.]|jgi:hypothetical protein
MNTFVKYQRGVLKITFIEADEKLKCSTPKYVRLLILKFNEEKAIFRTSLNLNTIKIKN